MIAQANEEPRVAPPHRAMEAVRDRAPYRIAALESLIELYEATAQPGIASDYRVRLAALEEETRGR